MNVVRLWLVGEREWNWAQLEGVDMKGENVLVEESYLVEAVDEKRARVQCLPWCDSFELYRCNWQFRMSSASSRRK